MGQEGSLLWQLGLVTSGFDAKLEGAASKIGLWKNKWDAAFQVAGGAVVLGFLDKITSRAGAIQDTAEALELNTTSLQALDFMAKQAGASAETLHNAFGIIKSKAADAAGGNQQVIEALAKLGINAQAFIRLPVDRQLEAIAKGSASATDKSEAYAAVVDLIGQRNAPRLNAALKQLAAEGIDGVTASAQRMGQVMSEDTITRLDGLGDRLTAVKDGFLNVAGTITNYGLKALEGWGFAAAAAVNMFEDLDTSVTGIENAFAKASDSAETMNVAIRGSKATTEELTKAWHARQKAEEEATVSAMTNAEKIAHYSEWIAALKAEGLKWDQGTKESLRLQTAEMEAQKSLSDVLRKTKEDIAAIDKKNAEATADSKRSEAEAAREALTLAQQRKAALDEIKTLEATITDGQRKHLDVSEQIKRVEELRGDLRRIQNEQDKETVRLAELLLKDKASLTVLEQEELKILQGKTTQAKINAEITQLTAKLVAETILPAERERLNALLGQTKEIQKQVEGLKDQESTIRRITTKYGPRQEDLTDRQLAEKILNLQAQMANLKLSTDYGAPGSSSRSISSVIGLQLKSAMDEQNLRGQFRREVGLYGESRALGMHSAFDEDRLKGYIGTDDKVDKIASGIEELNQRLAYRFPRMGKSR